MAGGPRLLLVTPNGFAARALLRTDVLSTLLAAGAEVTVLAPADPALAAEMAARGVAFEPLGDVGGLLARSTVRRAFTTLRYFTLGDGHRAATLGVKARSALGELAAHRPIGARAIRLAKWPLWRSGALRRALLALEIALDRSDLHASVLARTDPDLVVATTPGLFTADAIVLREAGRRGRRTAAVIVGWDNPTAKGYRGADVDVMIAWSNRMAEQLTRHHDVPAGRIAIGGVPHFDRYLRRERATDRNSALGALGLDPARRTVVFTTPSPDLWAANVEVAETLAVAAEQGQLGVPAQLVVRPHPNFSLPRVRESAAPLEAVAERHTHTHFFAPELTPGALSAATSAADVERLAGLLAHADVLVNVFSTTTLEALLVDTPVVALSEAVGREANVARPGGLRAWDEFAHLEALQSGDAVRVARSLDELVQLVRAYVADPSRDRAARARAAGEECGPLDGRSGERVGRLLLAAARAGPPARGRMKHMESGLQDPLPLLSVEDRCPVCGDERVRALHVYANTLGRISRRRRLVLAGCVRCGMAWSAPLPDAAEVEAFYASDGGWGIRPGLAAQRAGTEESVQRTERKLAAKRKIYERESDLLLAELGGEPGDVLDFGCGLGTWLDVLADRGWTTTGVEPNPTARATAGRRHRMLDAPPSEATFDLVVLQHVLEHLRDPLMTLSQVAAATKPGGHVFVSVPDLGQVHKHRKLSDATSGVHLFAHTVEGLRSLLALSGFELVHQFDDTAWDRDAAVRGHHLKALGRRVLTPPPLAPNPLEMAVTSLRELALIDPALGVAREPTVTDKLRDVMNGGPRRRRNRNLYRGT